MEKLTILRNSVQNIYQKRPSIVNIKKTVACIERDISRFENLLYEGKLDSLGSMSTNLTGRVFMLRLVSKNTNVVAIETNKKDICKILKINPERIAGYTNFESDLLLKYDNTYTLGYIKTGVPLTIRHYGSIKPQLEAALNFAQALKAQDKMVDIAYYFDNPISEELRRTIKNATNNLTITLIDNS